MRYTVLILLSFFLCPFVQAQVQDTTEGVYRVMDQQREGFYEPAPVADLLHSVIELTPDFENQTVRGEVTHTYARLRETAQTLQFNGRDLSIEQITVTMINGQGNEVSFTTEENRIMVPLPGFVGAEDTFSVRLDYTAYPMNNGKKMGMYFVDGPAQDPALPTQIWTLGQPEDNQYWFPGWDYPNDFSTVELAITVPERMVTMANGQLVLSQKLAGGMRTDRWVLEKPHASYLTGFVAGELVRIEDEMRRPDGSTVPLQYYLEQHYVANAELIFGETPGMLAAFESWLGVRYPWSNYKQAAVHGFAARGMENTTATVLWDGVQHNQRAHLDYTGRELIAHELAHQWFGNLVTARNWANLGLNEGFAKYFERLYLEKMVSLDEAQAKTVMDREAYFAEAESKRRPIIWYGYEDPYEMYDKHTYEKAALVLHQLRLEIGEEAWWRGLRNFLLDNQHEPVALGQFQRAMQGASPKNLTRFFDQWYRSAGHPELKVTQSFDQNRGLYQIQVEQIQDSLKTGVFAFEVDVELNTGFGPGMVQRFQIASRDTTLNFALFGGVSYVRFDAGDWLLADIEVHKDSLEWMAQLQYAEDPSARFDAATALGTVLPAQVIMDGLLNALDNEQSGWVRAAIAGALATYTREPRVRTALSRLLNEEEDPRVKRAALQSLARFKDPVLKEALAVGLYDPSYKVAAMSISLLAQHFPESVGESFFPLHQVTSWQSEIETALLKAYGTLGSEVGTTYIKQSLQPLKAPAVRSAAIEALTTQLEENPVLVDQLLPLIAEQLASQTPNVRLAAARALGRPAIREAAKGYLQQALKIEKDASVQRALKGSLQ